MRSGATIGLDRTGLGASRRGANAVSARGGDWFGAPPCPVADRGGREGVCIQASRWRAGPPRASLAAGPGAVTLAVVAARLAPALVRTLVVGVQPRLDRAAHAILTAGQEGGTRGARTITRGRATDAVAANARRTVAVGAATRDRRSIGCGVHRPGVGSGGAISPAPRRGDRKGPGQQTGREQRAATGQEVTQGPHPARLARCAHSAAKSKAYGLGDDGQGTDLSPRDQWPTWWWLISPSGCARIRLHP